MTDAQILMGPFRYIDITASAGLFRIVIIIIRRWLWADSCTPTLLLRWAHSGLSTPVFGGDSGPIQLYRHYCFGGALQDYHHYHSVVAVGRLLSPTLLLRQAHSELLSLLFGGDSGPIREHRHCQFGGPIQDYCHYHSAVAVGRLMYTALASSVDPFRVSVIIIR